MVVDTAVVNMYSCIRVRTFHTCTDSKNILLGDDILPPPWKVFIVSPGIYMGMC